MKKIHLPKLTIPFEDSIRAYQDNWLISLSHKFSIGTIIISVFLWAVFFHRLPPVVPLWYSKPWGEDQLTNPVLLLVLPIGSLFWYITSLIIMHYYTRENLLYSQILLGTTMIACILSFIIFCTIITLVL
jgi:hypothetical protein